MGKTAKSINLMSQWSAQHPFTGRNIQQSERRRHDTTANWEIEIPRVFQLIWLGVHESGKCRNVKTTFA